MSILAAAGDGVSDGKALALGPWMLLVLVGFGGAVATGVFRGRSVSGPLRLANAPERIWRLLFAGFIGCFTWLLTQALYLAVLRALHPGTTVDESNLGPINWAFLATVPAAVGFAILLGADFTLLGGGSHVDRLGLRAGALPGAARGLLGILIASPMIWFVSALTEWFYDTHHYAHPMEHELLKVMGDTTYPAVRTLLIIGAVILAPLFEETLFRGHIQTFFREFLCRLSGGMSLISRTASEGATGHTLQYAQRDATDNLAAPSRPVVWQTWTAILLASALFTSVHPRWMWPPLFFLAVCLGYAYERTGSLWTSIVMHSLFNATSTYLFLTQTH